MDRVSGYVAQVANQGAIAAQLSSLVRSGKFTSGSPQKVVLLGHSMGSVYSTAAARSDPTLMDAAILTGIAFSRVPASAEAERLASESNPWKWGSLKGYVTWVDKYSNLVSYV